MKYSYQLIIIGAGSGGLTAADVASQLGFNRVCMVEAADNLGGECLNTGCVPSKALLNSAKLYKQTKGAAPADPFENVQSSIAAVKKRSDNDKHYQDKGIEVVHGQAVFKDKHTIEVDGKILTSKYFLIATGSSPAVPPIPGLNNVPYHTNETIFELTTVPELMVIIGGGPIGVEMANAFSLLGAQVTLLQRGERILPREESAVSSLIAAELKKAGATIITDAQITKTNQNDDSISVELEKNGKQHTLKAQVLLVAVGRRPNLELGLENANVTYTPDGIIINKYLQTSTSNIYAVGDCTPSLKFTHLAGHQAGVALRNMIFPLVKQSSQYLEVIPWITYTSPEIGRIGLTEEQAKQQNLQYEVVKLNMHDIDRAITENQDQGFLKVLVDKKGRLLGATVVSDFAGELLAPLSHIYYHKQPLNTLATTVIPYPTIASGLNLLASKYATSKVKHNSLVQLFTRDWRK